RAADRQEVRPGLDRGDEVDRDAGGGGQVVGDEHDGVADGLDDPRTVGGDDVPGGELEALDECGELARAQPSGAGGEGHHVDEAERAGQGEHVVGRLVHRPLGDLDVHPLDQRGELAAPRVDELALQRPGDVDDPVQDD